MKYVFQAVAKFLLAAFFGGCFLAMLVVVLFVVTGDGSKLFHTLMVVLP